MSEMTENLLRIGNFTSSEIYRLLNTGTRPMTEQELKDRPTNERGTLIDKRTTIDTDFGAPAMNYIAEKNIERELCRSIEIDAYSRSMAWGIWMEQRVYDMLDFKYDKVSKQVVLHPLYKFWAGTTDLVELNKRIGEIKCYEPKNWYNYTKAILTQDVNILRTEFKQEYYQIISNACIHNVPVGEAISYMPYEAELHEIASDLEDYEGADLWKYRYIWEEIMNGDKSKLPYIPAGSKMKNLNRFAFEIPKEDREYLTERVRKAGELLINVTP